MADYLFIENYSKKGKLGISLNCFDSIISGALEGIPGVNKSQSKLKRNQALRLNRPIQTSISRGILHAAVFIDVSKKADIQEVIQDIHVRINDAMLTQTEQVPYDVQVKVMSLI